MRWQKWSFVIGFNGREGLTLNHVSYQDNGKKRSISIVRFAVGDGGPLRRSRRRSRRKNAFDAGEYGLGYCANSSGTGLRIVLEPDQVLRRPAVHEPGRAAH